MNLPTTASVRCPWCQTTGHNKLWLDDATFAFSCLCGTAIGGPLDKLPDQWRYIIQTKPA